MAASVNITSAITETQKEGALDLLVWLFNVTASYLKTLLDLFIAFFTRADVLWALVVLTVALFVWGVLKRKFFKKGF